MLEIIVDRQGLDRTDGIGQPIEEEVREHGLRLVAKGIDRRAFRVIGHGRFHRLETLPIIAIAEIELRQQRLHVRFQRIAAP